MGIVAHAKREDVKLKQPRHLEQELTGVGPHSCVAGGGLGVVAELVYVLKHSKIKCILINNFTEYKVI